MFSCQEGDNGNSLMSTDSTAIRCTGGRVHKMYLLSFHFKEAIQTIHKQTGRQANKQRKTEEPGTFQFLKKRQLRGQDKVARFLLATEKEGGCPGPIGDSFKIYQYVYIIVFMTKNDIIMSWTSGSVLVLQK